MSLGYFYYKKYQLNNLYGPSQISLICLQIIGLFLIGINGVTDASNAISTIVGTKVLSYRKACTLSAIFNMMGTLGMYYMNHSVTNTIGEIVPIPENSLGLKIIMVAILCTIFFSILSLLKGVPASESYGLIFGLVGAGIATMGLSAINLEKMKLVFWGILFSTTWHGPTEWN